MRFWIILLLLTISAKSFASHIVGGELYYDYLGNNQYKVYITIFRDCFSTGAQYDNPLSLGVFNSSSQLVQNQMIPFNGSVQIPIVFSNPCVVPPNNICIEKTTYVTVLSLPPSVGGYTLAYQRCCRGPSIVNIVAPDDTGLTLVGHIPGSETPFVTNSSPRFSGYPPLIVCNSEELVFNHSATDPDGDQLVYSLVAPWAGATSDFPMPNPPPGPGYAPVVWGNSFSVSNPLGPGASISINSATGILTAQPSLTGLFVIGIKVREYRNGILIGETIRDFMFRVINCNITMEAIIPVQEDMSYFESYCQGLTVTFDNNSYGATNYAWDFGVSTINTDVSTQFEPTYTYPNPGTYLVRLIANPGWSCTDTIVRTIVVNHPLEMSFTTLDSICIVGNTFNFVGAYTGTNLASYTWDFGPHSSVASSTNLVVNNVVFDTSGFIPITLNGYIGTCNAVYTDSIYIYPFVSASFAPPPNYLCEGLTVAFLNTTENAANYQWDFGVSGISTDVSTQVTPTFTFPVPGAYTVELIASSTGACIDTAYQNLIVNEVLDVSFTSNDSLCITGNSFNFDGSFVGSSTTSFSWNFGQNSSPASPSGLDVNNVQFSVPGSLPITLTGTYGACTDSYTSKIFIYREPTIDFTIRPGLQCVPFVAHFKELCTSDAPLNYSWGFGDETGSSLANPVHTYMQVGSYNVSLKINADFGCTDTFYLTKANFVNVNPRPISSFSVSPPETDICHSEVDFNDQSIGGYYYYYNFDGKAFSEQQNPTYSYREDGTFYPIQIVTNEFGCTDTSRQKVYIEPFMMYFPNAFTPDGNAYNNEFIGKASLEILEWDFTVYNKWGEVVFRSDDPKIGWDGIYKGKMAQDGIYTYRVHYKTCEYTNSVHDFIGHFSLLR